MPEVKKQWQKKMNELLCKYTRNFFYLLPNGNLESNTQ